MLRNLRPYYKFTAPLVEPSDEESDLWTRYRKDDVDANTLQMLLAKVLPSREKSVPFYTTSMFWVCHANVYVEGFCLVAPRADKLDIVQRWTMRLFQVRSAME